MHMPPDDKGKPKSALLPLLLVLSVAIFCYLTIDPRPMPPLVPVPMPDFREFTVNLKVSVPRKLSAGYHIIVECSPNRFPPNVIVPIELLSPGVQDGPPPWTWQETFNRIPRWYAITVTVDDVYTGRTVVEFKPDGSVHPDPVEITVALRPEAVACSLEFRVVYPEGLVSETMCFVDPKWQGHYRRTKRTTDAYHWVSMARDGSLGENDSPALLLPGEYVAEFRALHLDAVGKFTVLPKGETDPAVIRLTVRKAGSKAGTTADRQ